MFTHSSSWTSSIPTHVGSAPGDTGCPLFYLITTPLFSFWPLYFHLTLVLSSCSLLPFLSFCVCLFSLSSSSRRLSPSPSYGGLLREPTASVFVCDSVLAVLFPSMAHLFAPVKEKKKKTFPTYEFRCLPGDPCLNLCCKIFFFFPYEVPKK